MLPIVEDRTNISERCMALNLSETMWTDIPQFGCWRPFRLEDDLACLSFAVFVPNVMYAKGIASLMVLWLHHRIRWVMYGKYATRG
jgi:hypothetical protein